MRIHTVQKARKDQGICNGCLKPITAGQGYRYIAPRYGAKKKKHLECGSFRPSEMTSSDKLSSLYAAQESLDDLLGQSEERTGLELLTEALRDAASEAERVGEEYTESADSQEEHFPGSSQVDEIREKAEACEDWAQRLNDAADEIEALDEEDEGTKPCPDCLEERRKAEREAAEQTVWPPVVERIKARELVGIENPETVLVLQTNKRNNVYVNTAPWQIAWTVIPEVADEKKREAGMPCFSTWQGRERVTWSPFGGAMSTSIDADDIVEITRLAYRRKEAKTAGKSDLFKARKGQTNWEWYDRETGKTVSPSVDVDVPCSTCDGTGEVNRSEEDSVVEEAQGIAQNAIDELAL